MTKEELLYNWENQLVLFDIAIRNAEEGPMPLIASILDYQKKQLMACIADLKLLNIETMKTGDELTFADNHNPCTSPDPDDICDHCNCWKSTRRNCS